MILEDLQKIINDQGLRSGYEVEHDNLIILSKGYQKLGEINYRKPFDVVLNLHFSRQKISEESKAIIYDAIFKFVSTPIKERGQTKQGGFQNENQIHR